MREKLSVEANKTKNSFTISMSRNVAGHLQDSRAPSHTIATCEDKCHNPQPNLKKKEKKNNKKPNNKTQQQQQGMGSHSEISSFSRL